MYSIGLRYCGGCNPQIDRSTVIKNLKEALKKMGIEIDLTTDKQTTVDIVLLINGCMHACLEEECLREVDSPQCISIKGEMVGSKYVKEECIPEFLSKKFIDVLNFPPH